VTVRVKLPGAALDAAFSVSVVLPLPGAARLAGAKPAVTPLGIPLTDNVIGEANPLTAAIVTVRGIDPPRATTTPVPASVSVKLGPITVRLTARVFVTPPPEPPTVSE
jgi:hypothetical protein